MMVEVAKDIFISMNVPGIEAFNTNPKRAPEVGGAGGDGTTGVNRSPAGGAYARSQ